MESCVTMYNPTNNVIVYFVSSKVKERWEQMGFIEVSKSQLQFEKQAS